MAAFETRGIKDFLQVLKERSLMYAMFEMYVI